MKKKDIIQLVKESIKENNSHTTFYGNREQPSTLGSTTAVAPTDEYPFSVRPKRTATGMMEARIDQSKVFDQSEVDRIIGEVREITGILEDTYNKDVEYKEFRFDDGTGGFQFQWDHGGAKWGGRFGLSLNEDGAHKLSALSYYDNSSFGSEDIKPNNPIILDVETWKDLDTSMLAEIWSQLKPMVIKNEAAARKALSREAKAQADYYRGKADTGRIGYGLSSQPRMRNELVNEMLDFEKKPGDKIKADNFKNNPKLQPGKTVTYLGTSRKIEKNDGFILTLDNDETVNLSQFNKRGAVKEAPITTKTPNPNYRSFGLYNVIDTNNNGEIISQDLSLPKAQELANTKDEYTIAATNKLAEASNNPYYNAIEAKAKEKGMTANDFIKDLLKDFEASETDQMGYQDIAKLAGITDADLEEAKYAGKKAIPDMMKDTDFQTLQGPEKEDAKKDLAMGKSVTLEIEKEDMKDIFHKDYKSLDYIASWFYLGANYIQNFNSKCAFVSTKRSLEKIMSKILIIEDEAAIRRVLKKIISEENDAYEVEEAEDGLRGVEMILNKDCDSVFSSTIETWVPRWIELENNVTPIDWTPSRRPRRQMMPELLIENGAFYITTKQRLMKSKLRYSGRIGTVKMPLIRSFQIDTPEELEIISELIKLENNNE